MGERVVREVYEVVVELNSLVSNLEGFVARVDKEGFISHSDLSHIKEERRKIADKLSYLNSVASRIEQTQK